ncbi:molybdate ABC transporter substrate-binding protein [soil metagenome]
MYRSSKICAPFFAACLLAMIIAAMIDSRFEVGVPRTGAQDNVTLTISAASDLTFAFEELGALFEEETDIEIEFNFGSTGQLAQQIEAGAPIDIFAAANVSFIEGLDEAGLIVPGSDQLYGRGRIVVWTQAESPLKFGELADVADASVERIAIANPDHAPYGFAAKEALQSTGIWEDIQDRLILGENVSDTLRYGTTGNVDVAIVALSLAIQADGDWFLVPEELHTPIDQSLAIIVGTEHEEEARAFIEFLSSEEGRAIMSSFGFVLPVEGLPAATPTT